LLVLAHLVHYRGAFLVGVVMALLLDGVVINSLVLSVEVPLGGVLHVGLLNFSAVSGGVGGALVLVPFHIGCRWKSRRLERKINFMMRM
jgi:hypothetical protein